MKQISNFIEQVKFFILKNNEVFNWFISNVFDIWDVICMVLQGFL